jgi:hypothetical protein
MSDAPLSALVVSEPLLWHFDAVLGSGRPFHYLCAFVVIGIAVVLQPSPALILARGLHILAVVGLLALVGAFITETMSMWWQRQARAPGVF